MKKGSTIFLQAVIAALGIGTFALLLWEPHIEGVNAHAHATFFEVYLDPFIALVYIGSIAFFVALYQAFKLLRYAGENKIFSQPAVKALRTIKQCALAIVAFVATEEFVILLNHGSDHPAGGAFVGILITFGSIVIATAAAVFERILQNSVDISP